MASSFGRSVDAPAVATRRSPDHAPCASGRHQLVDEATGFGACGQRWRPALVEYLWVWRGHFGLFL